MDDFPSRSKRGLSYNKLYMAALFVPVILMVPALILNFSLLLLVVFLAVVGSLLLRMFVVIPKVACSHCSAKKRCPNAISIGLSEK